MNNRMTPLQAARAYAAEHPEFEGKIKVTVIRPKGRGGWGTMKQTVTAYARGGQAALSKHRGHPIYPSRNGQCQACGRVFLTTWLTKAWRDDERAGQSLGLDNEHERGEYERQWAKHYSVYGDTLPEPVYAPRCVIYSVCIDCRVALGMEPERDEGRSVRQREFNEIVCPPAGFTPKPSSSVVEIDLTTNPIAVRAEDGRGA